VGLGHFTRSQVLSKEIKFYFKKKFVIKNLFFSHEKYINNFFCSTLIRNTSELNDEIKKIQPKIIFLNNSNLFVKKFGFKLLKFINLNFKNVKIISIDSYFNYIKYLNHLWVPNIEVKPNFKNKKKIHYGWDKLLIRRKTINSKKKGRNNLIISLGGTDHFKIIKKLPSILLRQLKINYQINLLIGPFVKNPPQTIRKYKIKIIKNKKNLDYLSKFNLALVLFGVSFFELILYKIPCVIYIPRGKEKRFIIKKLKRLKVSISFNLSEAIRKLNDISNDADYKKNISILSKRINFNNRKKFYKKILLNF